MDNIYLPLLEPWCKTVTVKYLIGLIAVLLVSCEESSESDEYTRGIGSTASELTYFQDLRTGLCFVEKGSSFSSAMACVPCTTEVLKLISDE